MQYNADRRKTLVSWTTPLYLSSKRYSGKVCLSKTDTFYNRLLYGKIHLMKNKFLIVLFVSSISSSAFALVNECPWINLTGADFAKIDFSFEKVVTINADQVQQDLNCLRIVLSTHYSLMLGTPNNAILARLDAAIKSAQATTNSDLVDKIFSFHDGYPDRHLSYSGGGVRKQSLTIDPVQVKLSEELSDEKIYERSDFTYFKPGHLGSALTEAQSNFIHYIQSNDRPLVIDLRGNGGGSSALAEALAENLFTATQPVPKATILQVESGLREITHALSAWIALGEAARKYVEAALAKTRDMSFSDLIKTEVSKTEERYYGVRANLYQSRIVVITDSGCLSACETIVEKMAGHPKVKFVGAHTGGALLYSNAMSLTLPNSGIYIYIPSRLDVYETPIREGYGYDPMVMATYIDLNKILEL